MARARSLGNIRQLPSGCYQACEWHLGKQTPADTTFANKTDAGRWLATTEADMVGDVWIDPNAGNASAAHFGHSALRLHRCARYHVPSYWTRGEGDLSSTR